LQDPPKLTQIWIFGLKIYLPTIWQPFLCTSFALIFWFCENECSRLKAFGQGKVKAESKF
jgi:hypothetical protein